MVYTLFIHSTTVTGSPYHPKVVIQILLRQGLLHLSLIQLLHSGASITDYPGRCREGGSHPLVLECVFIMWISCGSFGLSPLGPKSSCPTGAVMTSRYQFSLSVPDGGVVHLVMSSSAMREVVWVVISIKSCPSTCSDSTWLNWVVWGHLLVDPRWIAPKPNIPVVEGDMFSHCLP